MSEPTPEQSSVTVTKDDYIRAKQTIAAYRESQKSKPKRKCTEKQLAALAAGRQRNKKLTATK